MKPASIPEQVDLLTEREVVEFLSGAVSVHTLRAWRLQRRGPRFVKLGTAVRYRRNDVLTWLESHVVEPEDDRLSPAVRRAM